MVEADAETPTPTPMPTPTDRRRRIDADGSTPTGRGRQVEADAFTRHIPQARKVFTLSRVKTSSRMPSHRFLSVGCVALVAGLACTPRSPSPAVDAGADAGEQIHHELELWQDFCQAEDVDAGWWGVDPDGGVGSGVLDCGVWWEFPEPGEDAGDWKEGVACALAAQDAGQAFVLAMLDCHGVDTSTYILYFRTPQGESKRLYEGSVNSLAEGLLTDCAGFAAGSGWPEDCAPWFDAGTGLEPLECLSPVDAGVRCCDSPPFPDGGSFCD